MHMHFCPPARSGVATRHRANDREEDHPACTSPAFGRGRLGTPGQAAQLYPCAARGAEPLGSFCERDRYPHGPRRGLQRLGELHPANRARPALAGGFAMRIEMMKGLSESCEITGDICPGHSSGQGSLSVLTRAGLSLALKRD